MSQPWKSGNVQRNDDSSTPRVNASRRPENSNFNRGRNGNWHRRGHWKPRGGHNNGHWGGTGWHRAQDSWIDTSPKPVNEVDSPNHWSPAYPEADWGVPAEKKEPGTFEELLKAQAHMHSDLVRDLVPFWLKTVEAAEKGEPEVKLESYLEEMIQKRKASGWYWSLSDNGKKDGDGWSDHRASNNGWGAHQGDGWGDGWGEPDAGDTKGDGWGRNQTGDWGPSPGDEATKAANSRAPGKSRGHLKYGRHRKHNTDYRGNWRTG